MTTDLENQFFDTFGIEVLYKKRIDCKDGYKIGYPCGKAPCIQCEKAVFEDIYPQITDRHYLQLICLIAKELNCFTNYALACEHLKEYILKEMILEKNNFTKRQVQALFKG